MILIYDEEENLVGCFDNYKECADFFDSSVNVMRIRVCRAKKNKNAKIHLSGRKGWYTITRIKKGE